MIKRSLITILSIGTLAISHAKEPVASNPVIWADVPDVSIIRVEDTYYMSSTTMHLSPGLPIMKSADLVNWEMAGYAYDRLVENDQINLLNGEEAYGRGSWASSLRFHDGKFYVSTFSATSGKTHVYVTEDVEEGPWVSHSFSPVLHDNSLFFDDDGRVYMIYGGGKITLVELLPDASGIKPDGIQKVIIENTNELFGDDVGGLPGEGSQLFKVDGKYYLFNIGSPKSRWSRTVLIHRADKITGPWEGRIALEDRHIAQGGLVDTPDGEWFAMLFGDRGAVGRIPYLVPVSWEDGWPVLGIDGKVPETLQLGDTVDVSDPIVASDDFERESGEPDLPLVWQWNHNPDDQNWSLIQNPGRLRITTSRIDPSVVHARNTLTQRTMGPRSSGSTLIDLSQMKEGDKAGLVALQNRYGFVGVEAKEGKKYLIAAQAKLTGRAGQEEKTGIVMLNTQAETDHILERIPLEQNEVHLKIETDFLEDKAKFYYSLDGSEWQEIGKPLQMIYSFPKHFMGYRFGLFNYATEETGGYVDFHSFTFSKGD